MIAQDYVKLVSKGPKGGRTLTVEQAQQLLLDYHKGQISDLVLGTVLMVMRARGEAVEEIAGFSLALQALLNPQWRTITADIDWPVYAGKREQAPWLLLSAKCLASQGYRIVLHGDQQTNAHRCHVANYLKAMAISTASTPEQAQAALETEGIVYLDLPTLLPLLKRHQQLQKQLGLRTGLQLAQRFTDPTQARAGLRSYFHPPQTIHQQQIAELIAQQSQHFPSLICFKGQHGESEVNPKVSHDWYLLQQQASSVANMTYHKSLLRWSAMTLPRIDSRYAQAAIIATLTASCCLFIEQGAPQQILAQARINANSYWQQWQQRQQNVTPILYADSA